MKKTILLAHIVLLTHYIHAGLGFSKPDEQNPIFPPEISNIIFDYALNQAFAEGDIKTVQAISFINKACYNLTSSYIPLQDKKVIQKYKDWLENTTNTNLYWNALNAFFKKTEKVFDPPWIKLIAPKHSISHDEKIWFYKQCIFFEFFNNAKVQLPAACLITGLLKQHDVELNFVYNSEIVCGKKYNFNLPKLYPSKLLEPEQYTFALPKLYDIWNKKNSARGYSLLGWAKYLYEAKEICPNVIQALEQAVKPQIRGAGWEIADY
ncbi:MAG: hypothetical protein AB7R69_06615 [Candidatus Babeliales bacterium]